MFIVIVLKQIIGICFMLFFIHKMGVCLCVWVDKERDTCLLPRHVIHYIINEYEYSVLKSRVFSYIYQKMHLLGRVKKYINVKVTAYIIVRMLHCAINLFVKFIWQEENKISLYNNLHLNPNRISVFNSFNSF